MGYEGLEDDEYKKQTKIVLVTFHSTEIYKTWLLLVQYFPINIKQIISLIKHTRV